jgi:hypothetical protein
MRRGAHRAEKQDVVTTHVSLPIQSDRAASKSAGQSTPLGWLVARLVKAKGDNPAGAALDFIRRDAQDPRAAESLVNALVEAATERKVVSAELDATAIRALNAPTARRVLAIWLMVAEAARPTGDGRGRANSAALWHENLARRARCSVDTVGRAVRALHASGAFKKWQAPPGSPGIARQKTGEGRCYLTYVMQLPRAVVRAVREFWQVRLSPAPRPEALQRPAGGPTRRAHAAPVATAPPAQAPPAQAPPEEAHAARLAALVSLGLKPV